MIEEKTALKLKQIANSLGSEWKVDFITAESKLISMRKGQHIELRFRKKADTKFTYNVSLFLTESVNKLHSYRPLSSGKIMMCSSVNTIKKYLLSEIIPSDLDQKVNDLKELIKKNQDNKNLHEYFIHSLKAFGDVSSGISKTIHNVDLTPEIEKKAYKTIICLSSSFADSYNISTSLTRDNIIKVIGFIKGLIDHEP